ncbi:MAG: tRNA 2-thiouridine(34) synthase MnmA [Alphaproteobacteria bacterium]
MADILERLEINLPPKSRILVAMSGGVDSSVVAAVLQYLGHEVIGATLQLYNHGEAVKKKGACCAGADIADAKRVAQKINIPHYVLDYEDRFSEVVIDDFVASYLRGETPLPCVRCNQTVKFHDLYAMAKKLSADSLATGHYVRRVMGDDGRPELWAGGQTFEKDQSYFLFATTPQQLAFLRFPLGNISKHQTRWLADFFDLSVAQKPDSQDICFVPKGDYRQVVKDRQPDAIKTGNIILKNGETIGRHDGVINYTVGQRRGLKIGGRKKKNGNNHHKGVHDALYVLAVDFQKNQVVVGDRRDLSVSRVVLQECYWLCDAPLPSSVMVKYRSTMPPVVAKLIKEKNSMMVEFATPAIGIAAGQALVVYEKTGGVKKNWRLLGGGFITRDHLLPFLAA